MCQCSTTFCCDLLTTLYTNVSLTNTYLFERVKNMCQKSFVNRKVHFWTLWIFCSLFLFIWNVDNLCKSKKHTPKIFAEESRTHVCKYIKLELGSPPLFLPLSPNIMFSAKTHFYPQDSAPWPYSIPLNLDLVCIFT